MPQTAPEASTAAAGALARLGAARLSLSGRERLVADRVLAAPEEVLGMSMMDIARACGVSDTTVLRMCRTSGFAGYTAFKLALAQDLVAPVQLVHDDVQVGDSALAVARTVFGAVARSLRDTLAVMSAETLEAAVAALSTAPRVLAGGVGASGLVAQSLYQRLRRLGIACDAPADAQLQIAHAALLDAGDLAIAISYSGATKDVATMLERARAAGAITLAITGNAESPVGRLADLVITSVAHETRSEPLAARASQLAIVDSLSVAYSLRHLDAVLALERRIEAAMSERSF